MNELNQRTMKQVGASRRALFELLDLPALRLLPAYRFEYTETKQAKVGPDYHIEYQKHYYSVPHQLVGQSVQLEAGARLVRIYCQGKLVAQHPKSERLRGMSTSDEHMPGAHRAQKWSPERLLNWGAGIGHATHQVVMILLQSRAHPEQAYRSCLGLLSLGRKYSDPHLEQACHDALVVQQIHYQFIKNLLLNQREGRLHQDASVTSELHHSNVRGPDFYH